MEVLKLLILKIDRIVARVPNDTKLQIPLYIDGFQVSYCHSDLKSVRKKLKKKLVKFLFRKTASNPLQMKPIKSTLLI